MTRSQEEASFFTYLEGLEHEGYIVKHEGNNVLIIPPYAHKLVHYFGAPLFIDGTFTSDKKTIIHVWAVSTTNTIILIGLESRHCITR